MTWPCINVHTWHKYHPSILYRSDATIHLRLRTGTCYQYVRSCASPTNCTRHFWNFLPILEICAVGNKEIPVVEFCVIEYTNTVPFTERWPSEKFRTACDDVLKWSDQRIGLSWLLIIYSSKASREINVECVLWVMSCCLKCRSAQTASAIKTRRLVLSSESESWRTFANICSYCLVDRPICSISFSNVRLQNQFITELEVTNRQQVRAFRVEVWINER